MPQAARRISEPDDPPAPLWRQALTAGAMALSAALAIAGAAYLLKAVLP
jgi:hypothetical protein